MTDGGRNTCRVVAQRALEAIDAEDTNPDATLEDLDSLDLLGFLAAVDDQVPVAVSLEVFGPELPTSTPAWHVVAQLMDLGGT